MPRRIQKHTLGYEHHRVAGHMRGHVRDIAYVRIGPGRRNFLFTSRGWKPHNIMNYIEFISYVPSGVKTAGVLVGTTRTASVIQPAHPTTVMFNYRAPYI